MKRRFGLTGKSDAVMPVSHRVVTADCMAVSQNYGASSLREALSLSVARHLDPMFVDLPTIGHEFKALAQLRNRFRPTD